MNFLTLRDGAGSRLECQSGRRRSNTYHVGGQSDEPRDIGIETPGVGTRPAKLKTVVAAFDPSEVLQPFSKCGEPSLDFGVAFDRRHQHADPFHSLLCP